MLEIDDETAADRAFSRHSERMGPGGGGTGELVLCTLFFPDQLAVAFPIALAIGNLVDPPATMVNAAGDYVVSFIVERFVNGKDWLQKKLAKDSEKKIGA